MKELIEKLKTISSKIKEEQLSLLGIESFEVITEAAKQPKLVVVYKDGSKKDYNGFKEILKAMEEIKTNSEKTWLINADKFKKDLLENISEFSLDQIEILQGNLKAIEQKLKEVQKEKVRVKTITISEKVHNSVKKYCVDNNLKMADFVEEALEVSIPVQYFETK